MRGFAVAAVSGALAIFALGTVVSRITGGLLAVTWPAERDGVQIARVAGRSPSGLVPGRSLAIAI